MTIKKQWNTVKENWLIFLVLVGMILFLSNFSINSSEFIQGSKYAQESFIARDSAGGMFIPNGDFAPEVDVRRIVYYANVGVQVGNGKFESIENKFEEIIESRKVLILNRDVTIQDSGLNERKVGYYSLRVQASDLDDFMSDLSKLGKVTAFSKNAQDITGEYVSLEKQLEMERDRLQRFENLLVQTTSSEDKIALIDKIFEQERRIYYIQDALKNNDERIEYASVSFSLEEKASDFANVSFVTLGGLIKSFVGSLASLISFVFVILPWIIIIAVVWFIVKKFRK